MGNWGTSGHTEGRMKWKLKMAIGLLLVAASGAEPAFAQVEGDVEAEAGGDPEAGMTGDENFEGGITAESSGEAGLPLPLSQRPLNLPRGVLRVDTDLTLLRYPTINAALEPDSDVAFSWNSGAGIGITDDIEAGLILLPLQFTPDFEYRDIVLYGQYQFLRGDIEVGARLEMNIPTQSDFGLAFGLPVLIRATDRIRIDTGLQLAFRFEDDFRAGLFSFHTHPMPTRSTSGVPLIVNFNLLDEFFLGLRTGLSVGDFGNFGDSVSVPFGFQAGYSLGIAQDLLADLALRFEFPFFVQSGGGDAIVTEIWQISASGNIHFDLF